MSKLKYKFITYQFYRKRIRMDMVVSWTNIEDELVMVIDEQTHQYVQLGSMVQIIFLLFVIQILSKHLHQYIHIIISLDFQEAMGVFMGLLQIDKYL